MIRRPFSPVFLYLLSAILIALSSSSFPATTDTVQDDGTSAPVGRHTRVLEGPNITKACNGITNIANCPEEGCGPGGDELLNRKKNRTAPADDPSSITVAEIKALNAGTPTEWTRGTTRTLMEAMGEDRHVILEGFLIDAHPSNVDRGESCNCRLKGVENNDFHLQIADHHTTRGEDAVVVEITPRLRPATWSIEKLRDLAHRQAYVRVTGYLFCDTDHTPGWEKMHRVSAWEIHPVTAFDVCDWKPLAETP